MSKASERQYLNVAYGPSPAHRLDLFLPSADHVPARLIVFVHGGAFYEGDKADGQEKGALDGVQRGYAVASINYRLSGEAVFPAAIIDAKAAIRFLRAEAKRYGLNKDKIAAMGDSAGGHIVSLLGTGASAPLFADTSLGHADQSSAVEAVVNWFGPINFAEMDAQFKASGKGKADKGLATSGESRFLGRIIGEVPELVHAANPTTYITPQCPPFLIQHGDLDPLVPVEQSIQFAAALKAKLPAGRVELDIFQGAGHGGEAFESAANLDRIFAFLDTHLGKKKH